MKLRKILLSEAKYFELLPFEEQKYCLELFHFFENFSVKNLDILWKTCWIFGLFRECYIVVTVPFERQTDAALVSGGHLATCFFLDSQCTTAGFRGSADCEVETTTEAAETSFT